MLMTADTDTEASHDEAAIRDELADYWAKHPSAVRALSVMECCSGFPTARAEPGAPADGGRDNGS
jgi:hypothetical protein